jgi:hypothetical protein
LSDRLRNICFVQGFASDRVRTTVRSRNYRNFDDIGETALVEEIGITSKHDRYRAEGAPYLGVAPVGKWATRVTNTLVRRKERRG